MAITALIVSAGALLAAFWSYRLVLDCLDRIDTAVTPGYDDTAVLAALDSHRAHIEELTAALADIEEDVRAQTIAIAEGIQHVDRAERRVRAAVGRARKRMADLGYEDEGLEAEAAELREIHGDERQDEQLRLMREGMEAAENGNTGRDMSAFPGRW